MCENVLAFVGACVGVHVRGRTGRNTPNECCSDAKQTIHRNCPPPVCFILLLPPTPISAPAISRQEILDFAPRIPLQHLTGATHQCQACPRAPTTYPHTRQGSAWMSHPFLRERQDGCRGQRISSEGDLLRGRHRRWFWASVLVGRRQVDSRHGPRCVHV